MTALKPDIDCPLEGNLAFASMGDIRRATEYFREDPEDPRARDVLNSYRTFRLNCIRTSLGMLRRCQLPDRVLVSARLKRLSSIYRKLKRSSVQAALNKMDDIIGFRIISESLEGAVSLGARIKKNLNANIKDYMTTEHPAKLGYRAIHGIARFDQPFQDKTINVRFEIQVRTWYQHHWACWCESHGEQAKEGYPTAQPGDDVYKKKLALRHWSDKLRDWECSYPDHQQRILPSFSHPHNVVIAWFNKHQDYGLDPFGSDVSKALNHLNHLETLLDIEPLLLLAVRGRSAIS